MELCFLRGINNFLPNLSARPRGFLSRGSVRETVRRWRMGEKRIVLDNVIPEIWKKSSLLSHIYFEYLIQSLYSRF